MNIFDDAMLKRSGSVTVAAREAAVDVGDQLLAHLQNRPKPGIEVLVSNNIVEVRKTAAFRLLCITCNGPDSFLLKESRYGQQTQVSYEMRRGVPPGQLTAQDMAASVIAWIEE
ncbi:MULTISPECIES: hypothetical protein [unclassified Bradyrhizobium]|uniref:hypothetical protein n=1 Tax=unclassified Bradyrhizobium TaxID=2631580 RepID=UPI0029170B44|nr:MULTISPECIES: hypothetical protein [unclassified Bradyrhizobium]